MGAAALPVILFTLIWLGVGAVAPYFVPPGPNKKLIQVKNNIFTPCLFEMLQLLRYVWV